MKKLLILILVLTTLFAFSGCGGNNDDILGVKPESTQAPIDINENIRIDDPETFGHDNGAEVLGFFLGIEDNKILIKAMGETHEVVMPDGYKLTGPFAEIPEGKVIAAYYKLEGDVKILTGIEIVEQMA